MQSVSLLSLYGYIVSVILAVAVATHTVIFFLLSLTLCSTKSSLLLFHLFPKSLSVSQSDFVRLSWGSLTRHLLDSSWRDRDVFACAFPHHWRTPQKSLGTSAMESSGASSFLRIRKLENFLNAGSIDTYGVSSKASVKEEVGYRPRFDGYVDDDGWFSELISWIRIGTCFLSMMVTTFIWALIMFVLIPWPYERIRQGNIYGHVTGRLLMWILGNPIKFEGLEYAHEKAVYICNHASPIDIFLIMWLTPTGTVGIAKKEIIWYPLFGQLYVLANHLRIDRSNPSAAIDSMREAALAMVKNNLSVIIFPEGTRSKNGRLLPFKKGFVHLALQARRPVVPIVLTGTHLAWRKGGLHVRPAPLTVKFLPPIKTDEWTADHIDEYVEMVRGMYVEHLPESQRPRASKAAARNNSVS